MTDASVPHVGSTEHPDETRTGARKHAAAPKVALAGSARWPCVAAHRWQTKALWIAW